MSNPDITQVEIRKHIIDDINSYQNKARKLAVQRRHDVYRKKAAPYVIERLNDEFDYKTVQSMRKVTSINPAKRIVDEQASLYVDEPERHWVDASEAEADQLDDIYAYSSVNPQMRLANRWYKLHNQCALYVVPRLGKLNVRALTPKDYDVIPDSEDPERAFAYVLNVQDIGAQSLPQSTMAEASESRYINTTTDNLSIADQNDQKALEARYVWWSDELHFTTDGNGQLIADQVDSEGFQNIANPIGRLPFIDVAHEKDFKFFVDAGSDVTDFTVDLLVQLSDLSNTMKFQAYSQAIVSSVDEPHGLSIGPNRVLWLKIDPNASDTAKPDFKFENPSPDLNGSLEIINTQLKMFLTCQGLNPGTVSGKNEVEKFTSGIDHLLANLDKFKATREDMDLFRQVEQDLLEILLDWHSVMYDVNDAESLDDIYREARVTDQVYLDLVYHEPEAVQTDSETLDYVTKAMAEGLMSRLESVKRLYKVDDEAAQSIIDKIDADKKAQSDAIRAAEELAGRAIEGQTFEQDQPQTKAASASESTASVATAVTTQGQKPV